MKWVKQTHGFTIVELLIVIVVIGILAAITIVAFNGVQNRVKTAAVQSAVSQASKKVMLHAAQNSDQYPTALAELDVRDSGNIVYQYTSNNTVSPRVYCVTTTTDATSYYISSTSSSLRVGICPGHNVLVWDKSQGTTYMPVPSAVMDMSSFRTSTASMRLGPGALGQPLKNSPLAVTTGEVVTVSLWIKTDSDWNGLGNNSKIRFGSGSTHLLSCGYSGVKTVWTQATCSYTVSAPITLIAVTVGNDGSVGNIWIDDLTMTRSE